MKIFVHEPKNLIRLMITRKNDLTEYLSIVDATQQEVITFLERLLSEQKVQPTSTKYMTQIVVREAVGGKNGKSKTVSLFGMSPTDVSKLIIESLK